MHRTLACLLVLTACGPAQSEADVRGAQTGLRSLAEMAPDPESRRRVLYQLCSELPACAGNCRTELEVCAQAEADEAQRAALLASCAPAARSALAKGVAPDAWFLGHFRRFLDDVAPRLAPGERAALAELRRRLELQ